MNGTPHSLLAADEPAPVTALNENGLSPFLIVVDHASNSIPRALAGLGVSAAELERHIAWDIGVAAVSRFLAEALDAVLVQQNYSRLVIDCNRAPGLETSILQISESTPISGNVGLSEGAKEARRQEIFQPYHDRIKAELDRRGQENRPTALIAMHSFTPVFWGSARHWQAAALYNRDARFAKRLLESLKGEGLIVGDNEPYRLADETDYTIPTHGERRGLLHVEVEIRQDLIESESGQRAWAALLARLLPRAYQEITAATAP